MTVWNKLLGIALALSTLPAPAQQLVGTKTAFPSDHHMITMERFDPPHAGSHTAIVVIHGGGGPNPDWEKNGLLAALVAAGYSVFLPHYFDGAGQWKPNDNHQFLDYIRTLNDATRYISRQPDVRDKGIGVVGISLGGYLALGLCEEVRSHPPPIKSPDIKAVVEFYGGMPDFAIDRMTTMPPVLILHGENDPYVSVSRALALDALLQKKSLPHEMKIYPHQGHSFDSDTQKDANQRAVTFLESHLH